MVLDPIPQSLPVHFFGSRPQPHTSLVYGGGWCKTHLNTTHCNTLQNTATHHNTLQHAATHYNTLQHTATYCNTLQHTATRCNTMDHTAAHHKTLQDAATSRNTLQQAATRTHFECLSAHAVIGSFDPVISKGVHDVLPRLI